MVDQRNAFIGLNFTAGRWRVGSRPLKGKRRGWTGLGVGRAGLLWKDHRLCEPRVAFHLPARFLNIADGDDSGCWRVATCRADSP